MYKQIKRALLFANPTFHRTAFIGDCWLSLAHSEYIERLPEKYPTSLLWGITLHPPCKGRSRCVVHPHPLSPASSVVSRSPPCSPSAGQTCSPAGRRRPAPAGPALPALSSRQHDWPVSPHSHSSCSRWAPGHLSAPPAPAPSPPAPPPPPAPPGSPGAGWCQGSLSWASAGRIFAEPAHSLGGI